MGTSRNLPKTIAFTTVLPFDQPVTYLGEHAVTAPLTFTIATVDPLQPPQASFGVIMRLVADGVNVPDLSALKIVGGSYNNTSGTVNQIIAYFDGEDYCYGIRQPGTSTGGGDTTAPVKTTIVVENATPTKLRITYDEPLDTTSIPANTDYILNEASPGSGFTGTPVVGSNYVELTLSTAMVFGDVWDLGYVGTAVKDIASNSAVGFTVQAITNNVVGGGGGAVAIDFDHVDANLVAAGVDGYKKINTSAWDAFATASSVFTVGETLTCKLTPPTTGSQLFFGLTNTLTPSVSGDFKYGLFFDATPNVSKWNLGTPVILTTWTVPDMYQIRWVSGTTLEYYKSTDGGTTWTFIGNQTAFDPTCNIIFIAINTINAQFENLTRE